MKKTVVLLLCILLVPLSYGKLFELPTVTPPFFGCSITGCTMQGAINMSGYPIYDAALVNPSLVEYDPIFNAWLGSTYSPENISIWNAINNKLNITDQRYNDTALILWINDTIWIELDTKLNITDQRYNDTGLIYEVNNTLYGYIQNITLELDNKLNITDQRYNDTQYILDQLMNYYNITEIDELFNNFSINETDPVFTAENASIWLAIDSKLNITDQRYNDTAYIINLLLNYYNKTEMDGFLDTKLNITDQRYNDTGLIYEVINWTNNTFYLTTNPAGYINASYANTSFYPLNDNPAGYLTNDTLLNTTSPWVLKTGDNMTGTLNMSNNSIVGVDVLEVHNITGRSPIFINSPVISFENITATNFYGNINGQNGTIFGMTITNGTIENMHVSGSAIFNTSLLPELNNTWSLGAPDYYWRNFYVVDLVASNISSPDITYLYNITYWLEQNKLNITDQRYNDTALILWVNQSLYIALGEINASIKQPTGPYLAYDNTTFWINETYLNNTINNISKVRKVTYNMTCTAVNGTCDVVSGINISYQITEVKVIPTTPTNNYRFQLTEYPNTALIIDKDRTPHVGTWDIEKAYAIDGQVQANITNANIDELFTISIIYLTNGVQ